MNDEKGRVIETKSQREPEGMRRAAVARRFDALFKAMSTDVLLREQFITDPAQIISEYVHGTSLPQQKTSITNQLLYSVLSNPKLLGWLRDYSIKYKGDPPSNQKFIGDFSRAAVESGGHHVMLALIRGAVEKESAFGFNDDLVPIIFDIFNRVGIGASGTEMSTGTSFGTEQSGTHMSTGNIMVSGTEMSTGGGTEMSTGTGGTEMSTGTRVPGEIIGIFPQGHFRVTLEALTQYAIQLRESGALDAI